MTNPHHTKISYRLPPPTQTHTMLYLGGQRCAIFESCHRLLNLGYDYWWVGGEVWRWLCRHAPKEFLMSMGGWVEGIMWANPVVRNPRRCDQKFWVICSSSSICPRWGCCRVPKFRSRWWGASLTCLRMRDPPLSHPFTWEEMFQITCLQSCLQTSPPGPIKSYTNFQNHK